jgi:hypothetical protein
MNAVTQQQMQAMDDMAAYSQLLVESELDDCMADRIALPPLPAEACSDIGFENEPEPAPAEDPQAWNGHDFALIVVSAIIATLAWAHLLSHFAKGMQ